jgi:hypothetical protein
MKGENMADQLGFKEFTVKAIMKLRKVDPTTKKVLYKGIHTVWSGYNEAVRQYYGEGTDPVEVTTKLVTEGVIDLTPWKGGQMMYLKGEAPIKRVDKALSAILG